MTQEEMDALMAGGTDAIDSHSEESIVETGHTQKDLDGSDMVKELGSVTADSEKKATQIFDNLDVVLELIDAVEKSVTDNNKEEAIAKIGDIRNTIFATMDVMQYQDIHRQKIERVINTMRSISKMMSSALDGIGNDDELVIAPSAKHIAGDSDDDQVDDDELAKLVAQMGNN